MEEKEINLEEIFTVFKRRKATIFITTLLFIIGILFYNNHKKPIYQALSRVRLPGSNSITVTTLQGITTPWNDVPTQLAILKSLNIRKRVIEKLNMALRIEDSLYNGILLIDTMKISPNIKAGHYILMIHKDSTYSITDSSGNIILNGKLGLWSESKLLGLSMTLKNKVNLPKSFNLRVRNINSLLRSIGGKIKIQQENNSFIARIEAKDHSPQFAKDLANAYAESYVDYTLEDARYSAKVLKEFLEKQVDRIEEQLKAKEDTLSELEKKLDYFSTLMIKDGQETNKELLSKYLELISEKYNALMALEEARYLTNALNNSLSLENDSLSEYNDIASLKGKIVELEKRKIHLTLLYSGSHPEVKRIDKQLEELKSRLKKYIQKSRGKINSTLPPRAMSLYNESELNRIVYSAKVSALDEVIGEYEKKLSSIPEVSMRYFNLKRKIEALKQIYENLLLRLEETKIEHASQIPDARILDYALLPTHPVSPNKVLNLYFAIILGIFIGVIIAVIQEHLDKSIKDPETAENIINAPILAVIPHIEHAYPVLKPVGECTDEKLIESLNRLKINLEFIKRASQKLHIIGISSTTSGEGKTLISLNLSQILALSGYRVLLVNGDLVKPTLNKIFGLSGKEEGLAEFLASGERINVMKTTLANLDYLPSGREKGYISSHIFKENISQKFRESVKDYDYVIFDTAPVGIVANTLLFANYLFDGIVLTLKHNVTHSDFLSAVIKELNRNNIKIIGGIFNDFKTTKGYGYKYYYYGYYYYGRKEKNIFKRIIGSFRRGRK